MQRFIVVSAQYGNGVKLKIADQPSNSTQMSPTSHSGTFALKAEAILLKPSSGQKTFRKIRGRAF